MISASESANVVAGGHEGITTQTTDRIAEGETRNRQILWHLKIQKTADNAAIKIYNKYYKRYLPELRLILSLIMILRSGNMRL